MLVVKVDEELQSGNMGATITPPLSEIESQLDEGSWVGTRMTADEFLEIIDEEYNYELIDGVVVVSPSPSPLHQKVTSEIHGQLWMYLKDHPVGEAWVELDVHLAHLPDGKDLVLKPEIVFLRSSRLPEVREKLFGPPDLVVEVISKGSRRLDTKTKYQEYERHGVREYWLFDPPTRNDDFS